MKQMTGKNITKKNSMNENELISSQHMFYEKDKTIIGWLDEIVDINDKIAFEIKKESPIKLIKNLFKEINNIRDKIFDRRIARDRTLIKSKPMF